MDKNEPTPSKSPKQKSEADSPPGPSTDWRTMIWFAMLALLMVWVWQDFSRALNIHTIPYSQFKSYVASGAVKECEIQETEILGSAEVAESDAVELGEAKAVGAKRAVVNASDEMPTRPSGCSFECREIRGSREKTGKKEIRRSVGRALCSSSRLLS
ncbi:ATP-dependent metallopeptidase FtsH/Yme1/Tma family protein [Aureliella helgolandensis]|uniref:Peptidase M41 FtsH extracellular domain-containing protein n=1 Tax=Aureliella helgolandensis TaxID=2527968 RepID=A0A518G4W9_9BACT|nr:ATP-dependent metallopeptidase FtsH/Yme1/Tma family protein [Aureliella helgolandensis]QDV23641.1 hypothetical protein Q31a_19440 [Aureliella helgolandensis]